METYKSKSAKFSDEECARSHEAIAQYRETGRSDYGASDAAWERSS